MYILELRVNLGYLFFSTFVKATEIQKNKVYDWYEEFEMCLLFDNHFLYKKDLIIESHSYSSICDVFLSQYDTCNLIDIIEELSVIFNNTKYDDSSDDDFYTQTETKSSLIKAYNKQDLTTVKNILSKHTFDTNDTIINKIVDKLKD